MAGGEVADDVGTTSADDDKDGAAEAWDNSLVSVIEDDVEAESEEDVVVEGAMPVIEFDEDDKLEHLESSEGCAE